MQVAASSPPPLSTPANDLGRRGAVAIPVRPTYPRSYAEQTARARQLAAEHPAFVSFREIGTSSSGMHKMWALVIGNPATATRRVLHQSGLHGRELAQPEALGTWVDTTVRAMASGDPARTAWLAGTSIAVIVNANPDGYERVLSGFATYDEQAIWHRGNGRPNTPVDLNRNFPTGWEVLEPKEGTPYYKGAAPASEAETQNIMAFARTFRPTEAYDWHSPGEVIYPAKVVAGEPTDDTDRSMVASRKIADLMGYRADRTAKQKSGATGGTFKDWVHAELGAVAMTVETGRSHHQSDAEYADTALRAHRALDFIASSPPA